MKQVLSILNKLKIYSSINSNKTLMVLTFLLIMVIFVSIFQDYIESERKGYSFFFFESLLFKSFWLIFPPILLFLKFLFKNKKSYSYIETVTIILISSVAHLILTALTVWILSLIFREQSYGVVKVLTFTLSNDLVKIILVYIVFIYGFNFLINSEKSNSQILDMNHNSDSSVANIKNAQSNEVNTTSYLVVNSGKKNVRINLSDILAGGLYRAEIPIKGR